MVPEATELAFQTAVSFHVGVRSRTQVFGRTASVLSNPEPLLHLQLFSVTCVHLLQKTQATNTVGQEFSEPLTHNTVS